MKENIHMMVKVHMKVTFHIKVKVHVKVKVHMKVKARAGDKYLLSIMISGFSLSVCFYLFVCVFTFYAQTILLIVSMGLEGHLVGNIGIFSEFDQNGPALK